MFDDPFTPDEQALIERLARAPQANLKPAALEAIRQRMFEALDAPPAPPPTSPPLGGMLPIVVVVVVIIAVIVGAMAFVNNAQQDHPTASPVPATTSAPDETAVPSAAPESTVEATAESTASVLQPETTLEPLDTAIVIEGPVDAINANLITIYGIDIELAPDDPLLTVIQVGDVLRVEGNPKGGDRVIIAAVTVVFVNVEVVVQGDQVWRDDGGCGNPPPPWAPAHGWRRRCESGGSGRGGEGSGSKN